MRGTRRGVSIIELSILIPVHNRLGLTRACLSSIASSMPAGIDYEILVFDDRSTDGTGVFLRNQQDRNPRVTRVITADTRGTYAANNNALAAHARGELLVFLNNDTVLAPGWLEPMLEVARDPTVGIVSNWHVVPGTSTVNHAGVVFDEQHRDRRLYEGLELAGLAHARVPREVQAAIAACWVTPRDLYQSLGGLDETYQTGYEDLDFCFRVRSTARSVICTGESVIEHHGGSSPGRFEVDHANRRIFHQRWGSRIEPDMQDRARGDGIEWPNETIAYRFARSVWRAPVTKVVMNPMLRTSIGVRARQSVQRRLTRSTP